MKDEGGKLNKHPPPMQTRVTRHNIQFKTRSIKQIRINIDF